jgi:transcriptional regulator with XRE-family HTH domain
MVMSDTARHQALAARIDEILAETNLSMRRWSNKAGLSDSHLGQIRRGELKGDSRSVITALARAVDINPLWLAEGVGPKRGREEARVERTGRYANLERVLDYWAMKSPGKWLPAAIDAVRATANHEPNDLDADAWEERLDATHAILAGKSAISEPSGSDEPPRGKRAKK